MVVRLSIKALDFQSILGHLTRQLLIDRLVFNWPVDLLFVLHQVLHIFVAPSLTLPLSNNDSYPLLQAALSALGSMHSSSVEASGNSNARERGNARERWAKETKRAIKFEEDPHSAALNDNPEEVFVSPRTWAAIFVSHTYVLATSFFSTI